MITPSNILFIPLYLLTLVIIFASIATGTGLSVFSLTSFKKSKFKSAALMTAIISLSLCFIAIIFYLLWRPLYITAFYWVSLGSGLIGLILSIISLLLPREKDKVSEKVSNNSINENKTNNRDYIKELSGLKQLLDSGALTQQEYDERKKKIMEEVLK